MPPIVAPQPSLLLFIFPLLFSEKRHTQKKTDSQRFFSPGGACTHRKQFDVVALLCNTHTKLSAHTYMRGCFWRLLHKVQKREKRMHDYHSDTGQGREEKEREKRGKKSGRGLRATTEKKNT